ncbi:MAG TPA: hypothetical protein VMT64_09260 [Candidatus Binataceae bacterium]|nr:hypothetical protein [Candidatus Binataceae bacterium]
MLACAMLMASCYTMSYRRETLASVALVEGLSDKLADYCRADFIVEGHPLSSEEMGEFYYGLKKARAFENMTAKSHASEASGEAFARLVDAYETFVRDADRYRIEQVRTNEELKKLMDEHQLVREQAEAVRRALRKE